MVSVSMAFATVCPIASILIARIPGVALDSITTQPHLHVVLHVLQVHIKIFTHILANLAWHHVASVPTLPPTVSVVSPVVI